MRAESSTLAEIRSEVCNVVYKWVLAAGVPAVALSLLRIPEIGWRPIMGLHIALLVWTGAIAWFRSRIPYAVKAGSAVAVLLVVGIAAHLTFATPGGMAFFVASTFMAAVFFGERAGMALVLLVVLLLVMAYFAVGYGFLDPPEVTVPANRAAALLTQIAAVFVAATAPLIAISRFRHYLDLARQRAEADSAALQADNLIRRTTEHVIRESEERLQMSLDASGTSLWDINPATGQIVLDRRWSLLLGFSPQSTEMSFHELSRLVPGEERAAVMAKMAAALKGETEFYSAVHRVRHQLGHWIWIESRGRVVKRGADGKALRMTGTNTDITARKLEQQEREILSDKLSARGLELVEAENKLREMTDGAPLVLYQLEWLAGGGLRFNFMSGGISGLAGISPSTACANAAHVFGLVVAEDRRRLWTLMRERAKQKRTWDCEFRIRTANGAVIWTRSVANISQKSGRTVWNGYWKNITESKKAEADLKMAMADVEAATVAKSRFLASMSHEIRTPLNGIVANLELLAQTPLSANQSEMLADADKASLSLRAVIGNILDFSKIESGHLNIELEEVPIVALVHEAVDILQSEARRKGLHIISWIDPDVPETLSGDAARLRQILLNLLGNAVKYTERGVVYLVIRVIGRDPDKCVLEFAVRDSGRGFAQSDAERLFDPFTRARGQGSEEEGTGLGLPICKKLVEGLGGELTATGELGQGAFFRFTLPTRCIRPAQPIPPASMLGRRVLAVGADVGEPNWVVRYFAERQAVVEHVATMQEAGHATVAAASAGRPYDFAVITDIGLSPADRDGTRILWNSKVIPIFYAPHRTIEQWRSRIRAGTSFLMSDQETPAWLDFNIASVVAAVTGHRVSARSTLPQPAAEHTNLSGLRVLVLEDRALNQAAIRRQLAHLKVSCTIVDDGLEGLIEVRQQTFDLVLADCAMPNMDGFEFARAVRGFEREAGSGRLPIVALTANAFREDAEKCFAAGMDDFLSKPVSLDRLTAVLERWGLGKAVTDVADPRPIPSAQPVAGDAAVDVGVIAAALGEDDAEIIGTILNDFIAVARAAFADVSASVAGADIEGLAAAAHGAKGEALTAGAWRLSAYYAGVEASAKAGDARAGDSLALVREELTRVEAFIADYVAKVARSTRRSAATGGGGRALVGSAANGP